MKTGQSSPSQIPCHNSYNFTHDDDKMQQYSGDAEYCYKDTQKCGTELFQPFGDVMLFPNMFQLHGTLTRLVQIWCSLTRKCSWLIFFLNLDDATVPV